MKAAPYRACSFPSCGYAAVPDDLRRALLIDSTLRPLYRIIYDSTKDLDRVCYRKLPAA
jgi:hypothetical protein